MSFMIGNGLVRYDLDWTEFKKHLDGTYGYLSFQMEETAQQYALLAVDSQIVYFTTILIDPTGVTGADEAQHATDKTDFETNWKTKANKPITKLSQDGTQIVADHNLTLGLVKFLRKDNGTEQMAVDGRSTGAEDVWDGTGAADTGTDWTRGGVGSEAAAAKHSGTNGLDTGATSVNDIWWFDYGSDRDLEVSFDSISSGSIRKQRPKVHAFAVAGRRPVQQRSMAIRCASDQYIPNTDLDVWQRVSIPLEDFNLTGNNGRFIMSSMQTSGQRYYFDDFDMLNSTGDGPYKFRMIGEADKRIHISRITLTIAAGSSGWNSTAFANIAGGLENGIILRKGNQVTQEIEWSTVMKTNAELFGHMRPSYDVVFDDSELLMIFDVKPEKAAIILGEDDGIELVVRDDLSTLSDVRGFAQYGVEVI